MSTIVGFFIRLILNSALPKALGPILYGSYGFVSSVFEAIFLFFRTGVYSAYYNYNSKNENSFYINRWFALYISLALLVLSLFVFFSLKYFQSSVWNDIGYNIVIIVFIFLFVNEIRSIFNDYGHSKYLTIPVQKVNIVSLIAQGLIVIMLYYNSSLTIANFSAVIIFCNLGFVISTYRIFRKHKVVGIPPINPEIKPYIKLTKEIYNFSHPLLTLALFTSLVMFFDRWYLQMQSGSIEQGFFHFASRLSILILLFNGAIIPILQKELVLLRDNHLLLKKKYEKLLLVFFFAANLIIFCVIFNIKTIISVLLNENFNGAYSSVAIVIIGTVFRSINQFQGTLLLSINKTKFMRNNGVFNLITGLFLTIILLGSPNSILNIGYNLGALGLSIKFTFLEIISVLIGYFYINKYINLSKYFFLKLLRISSISFVAMFLLTKINGLLFDKLGLNDGLGFSLYNIFLFVTLNALILIRWPKIINIEKQEIINFVESKIKNKKISF